MADVPPFTPPPRRKTYGWWRKYHEDVGAPKWRLVAARTGIALAHVHCVVDALEAAASRERKNGSIDGFNIDVCATMFNIPAEDVSKVMAELEAQGWLNQDFIVDWGDRQPEQEDPTARLRKRAQRQRDKAKIAASMGRASPEQLAMLSAVERAACERLAALSRVTAAPGVSERSAPVVPERILPFIPVAPDGNTPAAADDADRQNDRAARVWLFGDDRRLDGYGPASEIVRRNLACLRINAIGAISRWLDKLAGDATTLATVISAAEQQALTGDGFVAVIEQRIGEVTREREAGPALPFGLQALKGGRNGAA